MTPIEDIQAAQRGESAGARALFDAYQRRLMAYFLVVTRRDRDAAHDLTQETFLRVFRGLPELTDPERFDAWLWTIAHRVAATQGARSKRYADVLGCFELERGVLLADDDHAARQARRRLVQELLEELPEDRVRQIVWLRYTDPEHTTRQIAEKLDMPHGTVTVTLKRFRERIKRKLGRALRALEGQEAA